MAKTKRLPNRKISFEYPDDFDPAWDPNYPEFAHVANSVSLIMPYAEPYFVKTVRSALPLLDDEALREQTEGFLKQELAHHTQHRKFNDIIGAHYRHVPRVERWMRRTYGWLQRTRSQRFSLAFAAGSETIAFTLARWVEDHMGHLFPGADPVPSTLFLWHLAEEVEHKTAAFDVYEAVDGSRLRYFLAGTLSFIIFSWFVTIGTLTMLFEDRRAFYPVTYFRMLKWAVSYAFGGFPTMLVSSLPGHHPSEFSDPVWMSAWLKQFDPATGTLPEPTVLGN